MQSDLVGLRAELQKTRAEASKYGAGKKALPKRHGEKSSKTTSYNIRNAGIAARDDRDRQQLKDETPSEETARSILEKKALLYEKLHGGIETLEDDSLNEKYLVNFQRKIVDEVRERKKIQEKEKELESEQREREELQPENYTAPGKEEEWIEYTDVLGRTRECMRKDLPSMVEQDKNILGEDQDDAAKEAELISGENYREKLHENWEQEAEINAFKKDLHYQDVTYNEARMHGTGYMKFSQDEKERKTQMDMLKEMHEEASRSEKIKRSATSKKQKLLDARLDKVRQRKRLKLGLPMKDNDTLKTPPASDDDDDDEEVIGPPLPPPQDPDLQDTHKELQPKKPKMREWDVGKEGVGKSSLLSQEDWVDRQRKNRVQEFAPPTIYSSNDRQRVYVGPSSSQQDASENVESYPEREECHQESRSNEFSPPSTYEYYGPSSFSRKQKYAKPNYKSMENAIDRGLSHIRNMSTDNQ